MRILYRTVITFIIFFFISSYVFTSAQASEDPTFSWFPLADNEYNLYKIINGNDGNLWVTSYRKLWRVTTDGIFTQVPLSYTEFGGGEHIVSDSHGNLWMGLIDCNNPDPWGSCYQDTIGRITPDGAMTEFPLGTGFIALRGITISPDNTVWILTCVMENAFCKQGTYSLGRIPEVGSLTQTGLSDIGDGDKLTYGTDGNLWFIDRIGSYDQDFTYTVGRITPEGAVTHLTPPEAEGNNEVMKMIAGPDGNMWFIERVSGGVTNNGYGVYEIVKVSPQGVFTKYPITGNNGEIVSLTTGPDGNIWFIESDIYANINRKIASISPSGEVTEFPYPSDEGGYLGSITGGPDGNIWFVQSGINKVFRMNLSQITPTPVPTGVPYEDMEDSDGDGLYDEWEKNGVWVRPFPNQEPVFINLPAMKADPRKPDVYVHMDWMQDSNHNQKFNPVSLDLVTEAFKYGNYFSTTGTLGVNLHIDHGPDSILDYSTGEKWGSLSRAHAVTLKPGFGSFFPDGDYDWTDFQSVKNKQFLPTGRLPVFHYVIAAFTLASPNVTGVSRGIGGSDFVVAMGNLDNGTGSIWQQAGVFMHELGHNLGLWHGGFADEYHKPNYMSIMNYDFLYTGLIINNSSGHFDYSRRELNPLDESDLNEQKGIPDAPTTHGTKYWCRTGGILSGSWNLLTTLKASGRIDWNCDARYSMQNVKSDVNRDGNRTQLKGFNDWANIKFRKGAIGGKAEYNMYELPLRTEGDPITVEMAESMPFILQSYIKSPGDIPPVNPKSRGVIPVVILSTELFNVNIIKPKTVRLGLTGTEAKPLEIDIRIDENKDGLKDLLLYFRTPDTEITCGTETLRLTGETKGVQPVESVIPVRTVGCR